MIRSSTFAAFLFLIVWAVTTPVPPPSASLYHHDSGPADRGYHEVFRVLQASPGIHHDSLRVLVDEMAQDATWTGGPWLQAGDTFAFELVSYDQMRHMQLWSDDRLLAELTFGGGAGTPSRPDAETREKGLGGTKKIAGGGFEPPVCGL